MRARDDNRSYFRWALAPILVVILISLNSGCLMHRASTNPSGQRTPRKFFTSRWAMDDPDYHAKYQKPYRGQRKFPRMAKQMVDARHVAGKSGFTSGASASDGPFSLNAQVGGFSYLTPWLEGYGGLSGALQDGEQDFLVGLGGGIRVQSPTRLAPFVGVGGFGGLGFFHELANNLNSDDEEDETVAMLSVYPEAGVHYWLNSRARVTGSAGYRVTTSGRDYDHWFYGVSLSYLFGSDVDQAPMNAGTRDEWLNSYDSDAQRLPPVGAMGGVPNYPSSPATPGQQPPPYPTPVR